MNTLSRILENYRVIKLEYQSPSFDNDENVHFTNLELKTDEDLKVTWSIFLCLSKDPIEMNAKIQRSVEDIITKLQRPDEIIM